MVKETLSGLFYQTFKAKDQLERLQEVFEIFEKRAQGKICDGIVVEVEEIFSLISLPWCAGPFSQAWAAMPSLLR